MPEISPVAKVQTVAVTVIVCGPVDSGLPILRRGGYTATPRGHSANPGDSAQGVRSDDQD